MKRKNNCLHFTLYLILFFALIVFPGLTACTPATNTATALPERSVKVVGVLNSFPQTPNYIKKETFVFRHRRSTLDHMQFKDVITKTALDYYAAKGYKAVAVSGTNAVKDGRVDYLVQIRPMNIYKHDGTLGYGFYDRRILKVLIRQPARSYVCLNALLRQKGRLTLKQTGRQENFSRLGLAELPDSPDALTESQVKDLAQNLEKNIRDTVLRVLPMLGV